MIPREKQFLRERIKKTLATHPDKKAASGLLAGRLRELPCWQKARVIYGFFPLSVEPDWRLGFEEEEKKVFAWPRIVGEALLFYTACGFEKGRFGTMEPVGGELAPPADLILVPGVAFDVLGHRLGRGGGFYDRWLAGSLGGVGPPPSHDGGYGRRGGHNEMTRLGLCFDCQVVDDVPREEHDIRVDAVLTEENYWSPV